MTRTFFLLLVAAILATLSAGAETITNDDVIRMARAGLSAETINLKIKNSRTSFDVSTDALIALKQAGVHEKTIQLMIERQKSAASAVALPSPAPAPPEPAATATVGAAATTRAQTPAPGTSEPSTVPDAPATGTTTATAPPQLEASGQADVQAPAPSPAPTPSASPAPPPSTAAAAPKPLHEITIRNPRTGAACGSGFLAVDADGLAATGCLGSNFRLKWDQVESICSGPRDATTIRLTTRSGAREFSADTVESRDAITALVATHAPDLTIQPCPN